MPLTKIHTKIKILKNKNETYPKNTLAWILVVTQQDLQSKKVKQVWKSKAKRQPIFFSRGLGLLSQPGPLIHVEAPKSQRLG